MNGFCIYRLLIILGLLCLLCGNIKAQTRASRRNVVTVYSQNKNYKAVSVPHSCILEARCGKTDVYDTRTSKLIYSTPECMTEDQLFVSEDGTTLAHIINREYGYDSSKYITHCVNLYRNEITFKRISLKDLTHCDTCDRKLFFYINSQDKKLQSSSDPTMSPRDSLIANNPIFLFQDTIYIYTSTRRLIKLSLLSGEFKDTDFETFTMQQLSAIPPIERNTLTFESSNNNVRLKGDNSYNAIEECIMKAFNMTHDKKGYNDKYKYYRVHAILSIDRSGHATILDMSNKDGLPDTQLRETILSFDYVFPENIPNEIECWRQEFYAYMRKRNKHVAAKERELERQKEYEAYLLRLTADSINGVYIPRDIEDCFLQLDTLLSPRDLQTIRNYESCDKMNNLHFSLGMWIRNNWGLWIGSRLQQYCLKRGLNHPDDMSGKILDLYWDYLHGNHNSWQTFDAVQNE